MNVFGQIRTLQMSTRLNLAALAHVVTCVESNTFRVMAPLDSGASKQRSAIYSFIFVLNITVLELYYIIYYQHLRNVACKVKPEDI
jgi:hypothetical protein